MIANTMRRNQLNQWIAVASALIAFCGALLAVVYGAMEWPGTVGVIMLTVAFSAYVGLTRFYGSDQRAIPDFLTIFLVFQIVNKILTAISLVSRAWEGEWEMVSSELNNLYRWEAEWIFLVSTVLFWLGWRIAGTQRAPLVLDVKRTRNLFVIYGVSILGYGVAGPLLGLSAFASIVMLLRMFALGVITIMLYGDGEYGLGRRRCWIPLLMLVPLVYISLGSGMKSEAVYVSMPVWLAAMKRLNAVHMLILAGFMAVIIGFVVPLTAEVRAANWNADMNIGVAEATSRVSDRWASDGLLGTALSSGFELANRVSTAEIGSTVMRIVAEDGHIGTTTIQGLLTVFIPRVLWPDKPQYAPGAWFTWYLGQAQSPEEATSATAMMLGTELYWMFGWASVVIGMVGLGWLYSLTWNQLLRHAEKSTITLSALLAFLAMSIRFEELAVIYAVAGPVIFLVYVKGFSWVERSMLGSREQRSS